MLGPLLVPLLFLFSGAAGLTFELIWTRQLALVLGCTVTSAALVSGFFLLGLGMGARWGERLSRSRNLLAVFAALELCVALSGLIVAANLPHAAQLVAVLWSWLGGGPLALTLARVVLCGLTLAVPCLCMGASLPVLCSLLNERWGGRFLRSLSWLYAINTVGAVAGVLVCDDWLIPTLGLWKTSQVAACLDGAVALSAAILSRQPKASEAAAEHPIASEQSAYPLGRLYFACWGLGVAGAWLQVVWTRVLIVFQGSDQRAFSGCLATYLGCLAVGALLAPRLAGSRLGLLQVLRLASLTSLISLACLPWARQLSNPWLANLLVIAPTGMCLGLSFPWITQETKKYLGTAAHSVARALLLNTMGSLVGALATALVLIPQLGLQLTYGLAALWLALVALILAPRSLFSGLLCAGLAVSLVVTPVNYLRGLFFPDPGQEFLFSGDDSYGSVALIAEVDAVGKPLLQLLVDGFNMMSNDLATQRYATALAAAPCVWQAHPKRVLVICMGLCHSLNTALRDPKTEEVHCVELSPTVIQALSLIPQGQAAMSNPKLKLIVGDGRQHLVSTAYRYSVITAEPPPPTRAGAVNLYTRDFYQLCKNRLEPGGMTVQWLPIFQMSRRQTRVILRAFLEVFPNAYLFEGCGAQLCLIGCDGPLRLNYAQLKARVLEHPGLSATGWESPEFFVGGILAGPKALAEYARNTPALTDDWPILQYSHDFWDPDFAGLLFGDHPSEVEVELSSTPAERAQQEAELRRGKGCLRGLLRFLCQDWVPAQELAAIHPLGPVEREILVRMVLRVYADNQYFRWATLTSSDHQRVLAQKLALKPDDAELLWLQARVQFRLAHAQEALQALEKLGERATPPARAMQIVLLLELGQVQAAAQKVQQAGDRLDPLDVEFLQRWKRR